MTRILTGRQTLLQLDGMIASAREALSDIIASNDAVDTRRVEVREEQVAAFRALAELRVDVLRNYETNDLDEVHRAALDLLAQQDDFVEETATRITDASNRIKALEDKRSSLASQHDQAIDAYETRVADIEEALAETDAYKALLLAAEQSASIVSRAEQKLALARTDRQEKGAPYQADPLFVYLWKRKFRTPEYEARPFFRFMDGWVARLCKYDGARANYARLIELPERLAEHVERVVYDHETAVSALERAEADALNSGGADELKSVADAIRSELDAMEPEIEGAEQDHLQVVALHDSALENGAGPAQKALRLLQDGLRSKSFPDLRVLAAETLELEDDRVVDALVKLRAEEMSLELEAERNLRLPDRRRKDLETLERLRRRFKRDRLDSSYATFKASTVDSIFRGLLRGDVDESRALRQLSRAVRRRNTTATRGFGGRGRRDTLGLPDVLGDVMWEVAKEAGRAGRYGGSPWSSGRTRRRAPPRSFPTRRSSGSGGRSSGGFKTGGGF
ncbi:MAG: hypothetical protein AAF583_09700 [Pseudomonadota bacterium]